MKVAYLQTSPVFGKVEKNLQSITQALVGVRADLIVLPELCSTGYAFTSPDEVFELAETVRGQTAHCFQQLSKETGAAIIGGFVEKEGNRVFNSALIVNDGQVIDTYRKIHLFNKEKEWFVPGDTELQVHELNGARVGVMICFDWIFPEVARSLSLKGAHVLAHPSNLVLPFCQKAMVTRSIENRVFSITANRIGKEERGEDSFLFTGGSQIIDPTGNTVAQSGTDSVDLQIVEVDISKADDKKLNPYNDVIDDRRAEFYV